MGDRTIIDGEKDSADDDVILDDMTQRMDMLRDGLQTYRIVHPMALEGDRQMLPEYYAVTAAVHADLEFIEKGVKAFRQRIVTLDKAAETVVRHGGEPPDRRPVEYRAPNYSHWTDRIEDDAPCKGDGRV